jgi:hypothetical protein
MPKIKTIKSTKNNICQEDNDMENINDICYIGFKNDNVWKHIFKELKYDGKNDINITALQIKECKKTWKGDSCQFEPRLLC